MDNDELNSKVLTELVSHLQAHPEIQNIDLMNAGGFCRNCLAKWRHLHNKNSGATYDDSLKAIYGMEYDEYKKKHQTKATPEQLKTFEETKQKKFHADHPNFDSKPKPVVIASSSPPPIMETSSVEKKNTSNGGGGIHSNVCCSLNEEEEEEEVQGKETKKQKLVSGGSTIHRKIRFKIVTISDRASNNIYDDVSGPTIEKLIKEEDGVNYEILDRKLIPDDEPLIESTLRQLDDGSCNVILTTGGTGISPRDFTPDASLKVIVKPMNGICEMLRRETFRVEPLAYLSRGQAGLTKKNTLIVNLPGNPNAVTQSLPLLFPYFDRVVDLV